MGMERRDIAIHLRAYDISRLTMWQAYRKVKANRGSAGIDNVDFEKYELDLKDNLYKLWNRMSSGSYFPKPVKLVQNSKKSGGTRSLGIPTIDDRIAQMPAKLYIKPRIDRLFHENSSGYRPGKSAIDELLNGG